MKSLNPRITRLKELMELEERRSDLQEQLDQLVNQMSKLRDSLFEDAPPVPGGASAKASAASSSSSEQAAAPARRGRRGRTPRGELKSQIVSALTAAGSAGVRVSELAKTLGIKPVNVHSWFHSAMRRFPEIKKMDRGQYRLQGNLSGSSSKESAGSASAESSTGRRVGRPPGSGRRASTGSSSSGKTRRGGTRRGELSQRILSELTSAGAKGVNVRDLAAKIGMPYKNIYIWFATTGKKNPKVKKLAPATYKLTA